MSEEQTRIDAVATPEGVSMNILASIAELFQPKPETTEGDV